MVAMGGFIYIYIQIENWKLLYQLFHSILHEMVIFLIIHSISGRI